MLIEFSLCVGILLLIGFDLKLSSIRWKHGVRDLNPILDYAVKNHGVLGGQASLLALNLLLLAWFVTMPTVLAIFFGAKLALATLQIRSILEYGKHSGQPELRK